MAAIESVYARQILDSRGNPNVVGVVATEERARGVRMVAPGATPGEGRLGANAILGVSAAAMYAAAESAELPLYRYIGGTNGHVLPVPNMIILNVGAHADFATDIQEYMISPFGFETYSEALQAGVEVYHTL